MNRQQVIEVLKMENDLICFDPLKGEDIPLECISDLNRMCYDAHLEAIKLIKMRISDSGLIENFYTVIRERTDEYIHGRINSAIEAYKTRDYAEVSTIRATLCAQLPLLCAQGLISSEDWRTIYRFYNRMLGGYNIAW